jgi:hypothetical protein
MAKSMYDAIYRMEFWSDDVEQLRISDVIAAEYCVRNVICTLNQPGCG